MVGFQQNLCKSSRFLWCFFNLKVAFDGKRKVFLSGMNLEVLGFDGSV